jgi:hypothetical protein
MKFQVLKKPPAELCQFINATLADSALHSQVRISTAKWTFQGNLVLTVGPDTMATQLQATSQFITSLLSTNLAQAGPPLPLTSQPNVRWSKVLINSVPTGIMKDHPQAFTPAECHAALQANNPSNRSLRVTQLPSWVKPPSSYSPGQVSSLVVAFEDPDGTLLSSLLSPHHLFLFGSAAELRWWKQKPPLPKNLRNSNLDNPKVGAGPQPPSTPLGPPGVADPTTLKPRHKCQCTSQLVPMPVNPMDTVP